LSALGKYYYTLRYWNHLLSGRPNRIKFLATKLVEITCTLLLEKSTEEKLTNEDLPQFQNISNEIESQKPKIAIVVPAFIKNKQSYVKLNNLLDSIQQQTYENHFVIVVDDCSPYEYTVPDFFNPIKLTENKGAANARNVGIEKALTHNAEIIAFTDSDCILDKKWVENMAARFIKNKYIHGLSGKTVSYDKYWLGTYQDMNGTLNGRKFKHSDFLFYGATCNFAVTRNLLERITFDPTLSNSQEDVEFCFRIIKNGFTIAFAENMLVHHDYGYCGNLRKDFFVFWKQFSKYSKGKKKLLETVPAYNNYLEKSEGILNL